MKAGVGYVDVTIANGEAVSGAAYLGHARLVAIIMPATWTAATLTFQAGITGDTADPTYNNVYDGEGAEVEFQAASARHIVVDDFSGAPWIKVRSGNAGTPVNQGGARVIRLVTQAINLR